MKLEEQIETHLSEFYKNYNIVVVRERESIFMKPTTNQVNSLENYEVGGID